MCEDCYKDFGSPRVINDKVLLAVEYINELYEHPDGITGGYGHIVFDDWNYDCVTGCIEDAEMKRYEENLDEECRQLSLKALRQFDALSEDERITALAIRSGIIHA